MTAALLSLLRLRELELPNRIVVSPMCQYSAVDGCATDGIWCTSANTRCRAPGW